MEELKVKHLEAEVITLRHPEGKSLITLQATKEGAGIWIDRNGRSSQELICICTLDTQVGIGVYGKGDRRVPAISLCVNNDGEPFVQVARPDGTLAQISADTLMAMGK